MRGRRGGTERRRAAVRPARDLRSGTGGSRIPPSAQEVVGGERQSADPGHRWRGYADRQFRLRGLAELIAETTTHHLDSDPQLNARRWSTTADRSRLGQPDS